MLLHIVWQVPAKQYGAANEPRQYRSKLPVIAHINLRRRAHIKA